MMQTCTIIICTHYPSENREYQCKTDMIRKIKECLKFRVFCPFYSLVINILTEGRVELNLLELIVNNLDISVIAACVMYFIHEAFKFASVIVISKSDNLTDKKAQAIAKIMSFRFDFRIKK